MCNMKPFDVDIVIPWVNPADDIWYTNYVKDCTKYAGDKSPHRIRDMGTFKYFLRAVDTNMPWVRYVHVLLYGPSQIPEWLNVRCDKLKIHYHADIIPERYLPVYNSNIFCRYLHKMSDLAEHFIYFGDDMIPFNEQSVDDYFNNNGVPIDSSKLSNQINSNPVHERILDASHVVYSDTQPLDVWQHIVKNTLLLAKKYTNKFAIYRNIHVGVPCLKYEFKKFFEDDLDEELNSIFSECHFRKTSDVCMDWLYRYIRLNLNSFEEMKHDDFAYFEIHENNFGELMKLILTKKVVCINDVLWPSDNVDVVIKRLNMILDVTFNDKCRYEV